MNPKTIEKIALKKASELANITQDVKAIIVCTQTEYDALTPDADTLYLISG